MLPLEAFGEGGSCYCLSPVLFVCFLFCFWAFKTNISVKHSLDFIMKKNVLYGYSVVVEVAGREVLLNRSLGNI